MSLRHTLILSAAAALVALAASACVEGDINATQVFACPDKNTFTGIPPAGGATLPAVSAYMERRCGTLDCHGSAQIPMRIYGQLGRRKPDEGNIPGGAITTVAELDAKGGAQQIRS